MPRRLPAALLIAGCVLGPAIGSAQRAEAGSAVMRMRISMPDSAADSAAAPVRLPFDEMEMRITYATDGERLAMQMQFGEGMNMPGIALGEMLFHAIWNPATDSVHVGVLLPPEIAAQMGGGIGFRMDFQIPDTVALPGMLGDSLATLMDTLTLAARDLKRAGMAGGIPCEEWELITGADTVQACLAPAPPAIATANRLMAKIPGLQMIGFGGLTERQRALFGGRDLMPLRMRAGRGSGRMEMELLYSTADRPEANLFVLSPDLDPFPMEMITGLMSQMSAGAEPPEPQ